jgi:acetyl esterase/lipase
MSSFQENSSVPHTLESLQIKFRGHNRQLSAWIYRPRSENILPVFLYFHGGGFISGNPKDADITAKFIAQNCPAIVVSAEYSLAPAYPFPNAPEDAYAALIWIRENAISIGGDAKLVSLGGEDSGGNLATTLSFITRDRNSGPVCAQVLIAPMLDPSMTRMDNAQEAHSDLTADACVRCYSQYLPKTMQRMHPYAAPLESRRLKGMPPTLIISAGKDLLHIEAEKYAATLIDAGIATQFSRYEGITRTALSAHVPTLNEVTEFLKRRFNVCRSSSDFNKYFS